MRRHLPILGWLSHYDRSWLTADVLAGLSVWALLVPQALAYATIAGVPVQYGLYAAFAGLLAYAVFGSSHQVVQGPSATVAAVSAATISPIVGAAALGTEKAVGYTAALALAAGLAYLLLGVFRMGWVSHFLSRAVLSGFILGFAIGIIIDQSYRILGVAPVSGSYVQQLVRTIEEIPDTNAATLAVGLGSLAVLLVLRLLVPRFPRALVVTVLGIVAVKAFDLVGHGVAVTGKVSTGLFSIQRPEVGVGHVTALAWGAFAVVFVGFSETLASGRTMALKHDYEIDPNQELIAQGAACAASGLVGGFATDGSLSKTSVADAAGQRSQMAGLVTAVLIMATMVLLAGLFENLPSAVLAAIVIDSMIGLISFVPLQRYRHVNRPDLVFFLAAGIGLLFFGIIQGVLIGVVLSLLMLIARSSNPSIRRLGRDPVTGSFLSVDQYQGLDPTPPGVLVARVDGPLFFADAHLFRENLLELVRASPDRVERLILDAESIALSDTDGADMLLEVIHRLETAGIHLALARVHPDVFALWQRAGVIDAIGERHVYESLRDAVAPGSGEVP